ncbi:MoaD/ThiS family protein [Swaminathania salitolerans]|uniref:Molybdopterin synthase sulfur carrier subunit n=1 Tax=Swaminathania salitolerans TaxID=182838 RepID=A0A511BSQ5_9PROT|nr:MoaD/ThiS family protein [Swaminathania salitolerans]GBQ09453.1 molybdopterin converting factor small subunit [Swaminathania salitolerans LMG 21291]GEL00968.1 molybdopterin synthase sulfur carrier subunit [Swaminathania salitolerans]
MTQPIRVTLEYFALLRDEARCAREEHETRADTLADLYDDLARRHGFSLPRQRLRVAVNGAFVCWTHSPSSGDHVVFIPPVSGG